MADGSGKGAKTSQALVSVAMLKVSLDKEGRDYIDQLNSFIKEALPRVGEKIDVGDLTSVIQERFGLRVPVAVVESALRRLAKQAIIRRDNSIYVVAVENDAQDFKLKRARAKSDIAKVIESFQGFSQRSFEVELSEQDAEAAIVAFVSKHSIECLRSYVFRTPFPKISHDTQQSYMVARFINESVTEAPELFQLIIVVFKGVMLANAFTCPDLDAASKKFSGLSLYFDTPLVLSLLGLHGTNEYEKLRDLVSLLKGLKASVYVFEHTLDEVDGVLSWCESALQNRWASTSRVIRSLAVEGKGRADILLMKASVKERLSDSGVAVQQTPEYVEHLQIDEKSLQGLLEEGVDYPRDRAIQYDINSVRSVYALRNGIAPRRLEDAKAVFVTSNSSFARSAFAYSRKYESTKRVSPVITDYSVANIAWLKSPMLAADLPKHELLALCFAALEPSATLWESFLGAAEVLRKSGEITADELAILRADGHARQDLMDLTLGADEDFDSGNVQVVLERVKKRLVAQKDVELGDKDAELESLRSMLAEAAAGSSSLVADYQSRLDDVRMVSLARAKAVFFACWLVVAGATLLLPFFTPKERWFMTPWVCLVLLTLVPILSKAAKFDLSERLTSWWSERATTKWMRKNVPDTMKASVFLQGNKDR